MEISSETKRPLFEAKNQEHLEDKTTKSQRNEETGSMQKYHIKRHSWEERMESILYKSRWILSPMYIALIFILFLTLCKFVADVIGFISVMTTLSDNEWIIKVLELLDLTLVANLVIIVIFSGYENFVSKIDVAERDDKRLPWMGRLDFSSLKLKIIGSVVAISIIELLQDFLNATSHVDPNFEFWRIALHITFVITGLVFAAMEVLTEKRHEMKDKDEFQEMQNKF